MEEKNSPYLVRFNQVMHECDSAYHKAAVRLGLSDNAFWLLYTIRLSGHALTQKEISDFFFLPKQTVHSALKGFLEQGFLELRSETGRRDKGIHVTPKGDQFLRATIDPVIAAERTAFSRIAREDLEQSLRICRRITENLCTELEQVVGKEDFAE